MASPRNPPDPARRNERSRQAILEATADLLGEVGYTKLALEAVAARARVGKQTIYRWWPDKGALVLDAYMDLVQADADLSLPDTGDLRADLRTVLRTTIDALADPVYERRYRALLTSIQDDPALGAALRERLLTPWLDATRARLRAAPEAAGLRPFDLDVLADLLYGSVHYRLLLGTGTLSRRYADAVVAWIMTALPGPAPARRAASRGS
jgi:AcrR family transcriptional regulator